MGIDWTSHDTQIQEGYVVDAKNCSLNSWMGLEKRKGCTKLYPTAFNSGAAIKSIYEYKAPNDKNYVLISSGNALGYYDTSWHTVFNSDAELTPPGGLTGGIRCSFATHDAFCYVSNGTDQGFKLKSNSTGGLDKFAMIGILAPLTAPTCSLSATGITGKYKYVYCYTHDADAALGIPMRLGNPSPASAAVEPVNQAVTVSFTAGPAEDTAIKKIFLYRTLDLGAGDTDSNQFFKVAAIDNTNATSTTLGEVFVGTGLDDLSDLESTQEVVDIWVKITKLGGAITCVQQLPFPNNPISAIANSHDATVDFTIKIMYSDSTHFPEYFKTKEGLYESTNAWSAKTAVAATNNTYGYTTWSIDLTNEHKHVSEIDFVVHKSGSEEYSVSENHGDTWSGAKTVALLNDYGEVHWAWAAITGHTVGDYWKITTSVSVSCSYVDTKEDNDLTTLCETDNAPPPIAKFICLHKDRMIYANCKKDFNGNLIEGGASMFMFSSSGNPEKCPSTNYQFFDRADGNEITGVASIPNYLVVFKKNKIAVMESEFAQWYTISNGIGCIAPWSITVVGGKVYFLAEEGMKSTDGRLVYDIGKRLGSLSRAQYFTTEAAVDYTSIYYPEKCQILTNFYHSTLNNIVLAGHLLEALYQESGEEANSILTAQSQKVGYTYHEYNSHVSLNTLERRSIFEPLAPMANHSFLTLGTYTDAAGVTRPIAGASDGIVYLLDSGTFDVDYNGVPQNIDINIETGWTTLGIPDQITKTLRGINVKYSSDATPGRGCRHRRRGTAALYYDVDFDRSENYVPLTGGATGYMYGPMGSANYNFLGVSDNLSVIDGQDGKLFRFRICDLSHNNFSIFLIAPYFRLENRR